MDLANIATIEQLPLPREGQRTGWPWTEACTPLPEKMPDGRPWPKVSMVTPSYNQGRFIEETIRSVLLQGYPHLEYVVIDGGSTDDSVEIIRKYAPWLTYWVSEPDRGQSHAINKGLVHCSGDLFNWINSDDILCPRALASVALAVGEGPNTIVAGPVINFTENGEEEILSPRSLTMENFLSAESAERNSLTWHQPGIFMPLSKVRAADGVREDLQYTMDYILMINLLRECRVAYIREPVARFRLHPESKTVSVGGNRFLLERVRALKQMESLRPYLSADELKAQEVRALIGCCSQARTRGQYGLALRYLMEAILLSPRQVLRHIHRRDSLRRLARHLGRLLAGLCLPHRGHMPSRGESRT